MEIQFTEEGLGAARNASIGHIERCGNEYVEDWSISVGPGTRAYDAVYRSNQPDRRILRGNRRSGIYLILDRDANSAYVGLTSNFSDRFFNGNPTHPRGCGQDCRCHGHITVTLETVRSHIIINTDSDSGYSVHILDEIPYRGDQIGQAEIEWYYILLEHGYKMVNADWMLGKKSYIGRPIISLDTERQIYHYFSTIAEAAISCYGDHYSGNAGAISTVLYSAQAHNQVRGFTHRYATLHEVREYTEGIDVGIMVNQFDPSVVWRRGRNGPIVDLANSCPGCINPEVKHSSTYRMSWNGGPLNPIEITHLLGTSRGGYDSTPTPKFKQVTWDKTAQGWQTRWKKAFGSRMRDLGRAGPRNAWKKQIQLAIHREDEILEHGFQEFNTGKIGSNAKRINYCQPWRFLQDNYYVDWEDNNSGLTKVLAIYGGLLTMSLILLF